MIRIKIDDGNATYGDVTKNGAIGRTKKRSKKNDRALGESDLRASQIRIK